MLGALKVVTAALLLLRLAGVARELLPGTGLLVLLLATLHAISVIASQPRSFNWQESARRHAFAIGLLAICGVALAVRLPSYAADIGRTPLDIDEHRFAASVRAFFLRGELMHDTVENYPGAVFWLFSAASFLSYMRSLVGGAATPIAGFPVERFVEAARTVNILVGMFTVFTTGLIGRRLAGPAVGLLSAGVLAVVPLAVDSTVFARNDPGMVLAVCATTLAALVYYDTRRTAWIVWAGLLAGIAGAIKYSAVFALVPVAIASVTGTAAGQRLRTSVYAFGSFVAAVAVTNHFMWADFPNFLRQLSDQVAITGSGHWGATTNPGRYYLDTLTGPGAGWALVLLAAGYTAHALATHDARRWIVVSFPVLYIWFMTGRPSQFPRWVYPMLPYVAITGSAALVAVARVLHERLASRPQPFARSAELAVAGLMLVVFLQPAWGGAISFSRRVTPTTQALTENWLRTNAQEGSVVLLGRGWLDVRDARFSARRVPNLKATLDGGVEQLAGCNWVVVPETVFGHPSLKQLSLAQRFEAGYGFGGNLGYDYEVYAVPDLPAHGNCGGTDAEVRR